MNKLAASLLTLSALALGACDFGCYEILPVEPAPAHLKEGAWAFQLSDVELSGECADIEAPEAEDLRLRGSIFYTNGQRIEVEIEGLLLEGAQEGAWIYAEGSEWYGVATDEPDYDDEAEPEDEHGDDGEDDGDEDAPSDEPCEEEDARCGDGEDIDFEDAPADLYAYIDGRIDSPISLRGELLVEQNFPGEHCVIQARYDAHYAGNSAPHDQPMPDYAP